MLNIKAKSQTQAIYASQSKMYKQIQRCLVLNYHNFPFNERNTASWKQLIITLYKCQMIVIKATKHCILQLIYSIVGSLVLVNKAGKHSSYISSDIEVRSDCGAGHNVHIICIEPIFGVRSSMNWIDILLQSPQVSIRHSK